jgi:arylsulfatase
LLLAVCVALVPSVAWVADAPPRPNVVFILADDLGYGDLGSYGATGFATPNLDRLAREGVRFTEFYTPANTCSPSRAALLTGRYPPRSGVNAVLFHDTPEGLPASELTIAELLHDAGYRTAMVGKWHVGGPLLGSRRQGPVDPARNPRPTDRGFERFFGTLLGAGSYYAPASLTEGESPVAPGEGFYYPDAIGERAERTIDELGRSSAPFFLYVAHVAPHWPLHAPAHDVEPHRGRYTAGWDAVRSARHERLRDAGLVERTWSIHRRDPALPEWGRVPDPSWEDARMAVYAAQLTAVDRSVGRIVTKLRELAIDERTIVVFLSDNGGCAELLPTNLAGSVPGGADSFMSYGLPWARVSNTPFYRYKRWVHEGGIATPFVACWPGVIPAGHVSHEPAHVVDLMPTFLELSGAPAPRERAGRVVRPLEGQSLAAVLEGRPSERVGALAWEHEGNRALRLGELKIVSPFGAPWELYRMDEDRTETTDLAERYPRDVRRLESLHADWARRTGVIAWDALLPRLPRWVGTSPPEG